MKEHEDMTGEEIFARVGEIVSPVYMVGGSVRDKILRKIPYDYDFATPLSPLAVEERIRSAGKRPYMIGNRFGTIAMKVGGMLVEITTFRTETYTEGSRKPDVEYVSSLEEDLKRRDFTINSLAMKSDGEIVDCFGGKEDIERRLIRCVGNPEQRFKEDPLRMLRAARLSSQLDFAIDCYIFDAVKDMRHKILEVSKERWCMEINKLLLTDSPRRGLQFLFETRLFDWIIPELGFQYEYDQMNPHHTHKLHEHTIRVVENTLPDTILRWAALLHDIGKPFVRTESKKSAHYYKHELLGAEMAEMIGKHLRWSNMMVETVSAEIADHMKKGSSLYEADKEAK